MRSRWGHAHKHRGPPSAICSVIAGLVLAITAESVAAQAKAESPVIAGYVFTRGAVLQSNQIDPHKVTRINFAFANIKNGRVVLGEPVDAQNLTALVKLRHDNPSLTVLVSVGGWLGSAQFSDISLTKGSRQLFIESAVELVDGYDLDGLDVDWEYPGMEGAGHPFRAADKRNFTLLVKELRERLDRESKKTGKRLYLTIAAGAFDEFLAHTEMNEVARYVDTVNLMTYDSYEAGSDAITGNHAPLFADPADPKRSSADSVVQSFEKAGVPSAKILLGVPFYGRMWGSVPDQSHGLFQPGKPIPNAEAPYRLIAATMLNQGFTRYWDSAASVPYLYNAEKRIFVSYEDPESLATKCSYVLSRKLGGIMFWEYFGDDSGKLLDTINRTLHNRSR
jgi:chitinase